jgi:type I restriction enzyme S subunit
MSEWVEYKVGDIAKIENGFAFKSKDFVNEGVPIIKIKNVKPNSININDLSYVTSNLASKLTKYEIKKGDILITMSGNRIDGSPDSWVGKVATFKLDGIFLLNQRVSKIIVNSEKINPNYLNYVLGSFEFQNYFINEANSSGGQANISPETVRNTIFIAPSLPTQTAIAEILSSLDDKIELNNKINQELETLAQTLFKQWFIDFEFPNENGEPYKSSGGEMVESELGEIPKGWEAGNLNQIAELLKKNIKPFEHPDLIYHHYSLPEFDSGKTPSRELGEKILSSKYQVVENSILVSKLNPRIPRVWTIIKPSQNSICSTEFQVMKPIDDKFFPFVNCLCSSKGYVNSIQSKVTGTSSSHQRVNPNDIINYEMILPPFGVISQFYEAVYESLEIIDKNRIENIQLTNLRDTLLPKLISGELSLNEISNQ